MISYLGLTPGLPLMPEMADARKDHCEVAIVGGGNHFLVGDGAAGLDGGGCARFGRRDESFGEREGLARNVIQAFYPDRSWIFC